MPLWLAIALPSLPLQLAARALDRAAPLVIVDGPPVRRQVAFCNDAAAACGIAPGLPLAAAQALARELIAVERDREQEHAALQELAAWAYQFSPQIAVRAAGLLLEVGASLRLFGGQAPLHRRIAHGLRALGYRAAFGYAATAQAAWWIAAARAGGQCAADAPDAAQLPAAIAPLPLRLADWDESVIEALDALGLATFGDLLALPRDQVNRRFGVALLTDLDRALGRLPELQPPYTPPASFRARIELPAPVDDAARLLLPARRLLHGLEGFLRGRGAGTTELRFTATHEVRRPQPLPPTSFVLTLAAPERDGERLARLLAERLTRVQLPAPAVALALAVERLLPYAPRPASLLPPAPQQASGTGWLQLAEILHARFGSARVFQLQCADDHRPECAYRIVPLAVEAAAAPAPAHVTAPRPLLLLQRPVPLTARTEIPEYGGLLRLLAGPERIESGWWAHGNPHRTAVFRDYFIARNARGQTLWIFRDLAAPRQWFLHGVFA
ncbi:MAG: DNA polymerase Y family protein [Sutterellaceae bacterium]|nr:DNA polymerase Y family protein [Burkholderiaceae bacterium]MDW8430954.1 DNA polymerase Y family protein [Sutterellaceae bacterium]